MNSAGPRYKHEPAYDAGFLQVSKIHNVHYEQYGKKDGKPVIFLHGGPGGGTTPGNANFFNPAVYRVILLDQRGAGQSTPLAETRENQSMDLVSDIEVLRKHLGIQRWHVFGGSWGSTLSLLYAQTHPEAVVSLAVRGVFFESKEELDFNTRYQGTWRIHPELYEEVIGLLDEEEQKDVFDAYDKRMKCGDRAREVEAARMYNKWSYYMAFLLPTDEGYAREVNCSDQEALAHAKVQCHYHAQNAWLEDMQFLKKENIEKIKHIPTGIVNGRYDLLCPPIMAWKLHKALPGSKLYIIPDAGHASTEPGTRAKLTDIMDEFASLEV